MVMLVGIDANIHMTRPSGDDVVAVEEMDSSRVELVGYVFVASGLDFCYGH